MAIWVDLTAPENWEPKFYPYDTKDGCVWRYAAAAASAFVYDFTGGEWVGPALQFVPPNDVMSASLPVLEYIGETDVSATIGLRVTCRIGADITLDESGFHRFILVGVDPTNTFGVDTYYKVFSEELENGFYASGTEFIIEGACFPENLQYVTALFTSYDVDNCGVYLDYLDNAMTITKIEVQLDAPPQFWTDFVGCAETIG